jgi:hypothetical protein
LKNAHLGEGSLLYDFHLEEIYFFYLGGFEEQPQLK